MIRFSIDVAKHGKKWCTVIVEASDANGILKDVLGQSAEDQGYRHTIWREREARRIVEVTDQARIIGATYDRERHAAATLSDGDTENLAAGGSDQ